MPNVTPLTLFFIGSAAPSLRLPCYLFLCPSLSRRPAPTCYLFLCYPPSCSPRVPPRPYLLSLFVPPAYRAAPAPA